MQKEYRLFNLGLSESKTLWKEDIPSYQSMDARQSCLVQSIVSVLYVWWAGSQCFTRATAEWKLKKKSSLDFLFRYFLSWIHNSRTGTWRTKTKDISSEMSWNLWSGSQLCCSFTLLCGVSDDDAVTALCRSMRVLHSADTSSSNTRA